MRNILKVIFGRVLFTVLCVLIQVIWIISFILKLKDYYVGFEIVLTIISIIVVIVMSAKSDNSAARLSWTICILAFPAFGICLYLMFGRSGLTKKARKKYDSINQKFATALAQDTEVITSLKEKNIYIHNHPIWQPAQAK